MPATRRDLEDAARRRFDFDSDDRGPFPCSVERCDRPAAAHDNEDKNYGMVCLLHLLERVGLIASFPAYASLPSKVVPQRTCTICDEPATHQLVMDFRSWNMETQQGSGSQNEWPVCFDHRAAFPVWSQDERGVWRAELTDRATSHEAQQTDEGTT